MPLKHSIDPDQYFDKLRKAIKDTPRIAGAEAVKHFRENFEKGGFVDVTRKRWKPRKGEGRRPSRGVLIQSGRLMRSIRIVRVNRRGVRVASDVPYAKIHNEGGTINTTQNVTSHERTSRSGRSHRVSAHTRNVNIKMPQRKFMGNSRALNEKILREVKRRINSI